MRLFVFCLIVTNTVVDSYYTTLPKCTVRPSVCLSVYPFYSGTCVWNSKV